MLSRARHEVLGLQLQAAEECGRAFVEVPCDQLRVLLAASDLPERKDPLPDPPGAGWQE